MNGMKSRFAELGFTLMEVNLAIFIMAAGVLAMVSLYPLGYRESQQSKDDVKAAAIADAVFNQISGALSQRALKWDDWRNTVDAAVNATGGSSANGSSGWAAYCEKGGGFVPKKKGSINGTAQSVFNALVSRCSPKPSWTPGNDYVWALVAQPGHVRIPNGDVEIDKSRICLSLRVSRRAGALFAQPIYFTEIHFQGDQERQ